MPFPVDFESSAIDEAARGNIKLTVDVPFVVEFDRGAGARCADQREMYPGVEGFDHEPPPFVERAERFQEEGRMRAVATQDSVFYVVRTVGQAAYLVNDPPEKVDDLQHRAPDIELDDAMNDQYVVNVYPESFSRIVAFERSGIEGAQRGCDLEILGETSGVFHRFVVDPPGARVEECALQGTKEAFQPGAGVPVRSACGRRAFIQGGLQRNELAQPLHE